jgi:hypothetical protein
LPRVEAEKVLCKPHPFPQTLIVIFNVPENLHLDSQLADISSSGTRMQARSEEAHMHAGSAADRAKGNL